MKRASALFIKLLVLTIVYFVSFAAISAALFPIPSQPAAEQGKEVWALLVVSFLNTAVLTYLISRSHWFGWKLAAAVFVVLFGVVTFMSQIETAFFVTSLPADTLARIVLSGAGVAAVFSVLAVLVLGKRRAQLGDPLPVSRLQMPAREWALKLALIIGLYIVIYFTFGYFIAWQNETLRAYYDGAAPQGFFSHLKSILFQQPSVFALQALRALLWTGLAVLIIRMLKGGWLESALAVALTFSVVMNSQLLIPNPFMPYEVRMVHLLETATSNFLFGALLVWILSLGSKMGSASTHDASGL